jgi:hypothetical protein
MKHYYYAVDEFGDKFRRFVRINEARAFIKSRPGWTLVKELCIIAPTIDWNTFEEALF